MWGEGFVPVALSLYLLAMGLSMQGWVFLIRAAAGVALVTLVTNRVARPVPGLGIATPFFVPPLAALVAGLALGTGAGMAAVIAYLSGTLGTLIGADLLNIGRIGELNAPLVSIGGAGTFDGIFLSGGLAAFLA